MSVYSVNSAKIFALQREISKLQDEINDSFWDQSIKEQELHVAQEFIDKMIDKLHEVSDQAKSKVRSCNF
jgi:ubiquitin C-terminal hydrolase